MTIRREFVQSIPVVATGIALTGETVIAPNGAITTHAALDVNAGMGVSDKIADEIIEGVYHLRMWGLAHTIAVIRTCLAMIRFGFKISDRP
jgi:hypothetical protein